MDIDLLSKMVKEVVMDHDCVTLPSLGSFVTEIVPATFTDRGYTILPPYRRLFFSPKQGTDTLLVDIYRKSNPEASVADATRILVDFLQEMKEVLKVRKTIVFPGLGRLRATKENNFFFVADEDLDIYPDGFGLKPISLKTHEETPEETEAAVAQLAGILEAEPEEMPVQADEVSPEIPEVVADLEPVAEEAPAAEAPVPAPAEDPAPAEEPEPIEEPVPVEDPSPVAEDPAPVAEEPAAEPEPEPEPEPAAEEPAAEPETETVPEPVPEPVPDLKPEQPSAPRKMPRWPLITLVVLLSIIVLAALVLAIMGRVNPQWLDQFLYSPEELEVLYPGRL